MNTTHSIHHISPLSHHAGLFRFSPISSPLPSLALTFSVFPVKTPVTAASTALTPLTCHSSPASINSSPRGTSRSRKRRPWLTIRHTPAVRLSTAVHIVYAHSPRRAVVVRARRRRWGPEVGGDSDDFGSQAHTEGGGGYHGRDRAGVGDGLNSLGYSLDGG